MTNVVAFDFFAQRALAREQAEDRLARAVTALHKGHSARLTPERFAALQAAVRDADQALRAIGVDAGYLRAGE